MLSMQTCNLQILIFLKIFGLINTFAYAFDAVILFKEWKAWTDIGIGRGSNASPNP